ncbi:Putative translation regulator, IMPACT (imprinted ancient) protein family [Cupriavidus necator]
MNAGSRRFCLLPPFRLPTYTLANPVRAEIEIRKSRFLALALPVADRDAAMAALQALRAEHPTATHVCWALLAGGASGMSDDGEPSGTAGRPILEVLRHHDLDGVLAAVVRYYGGVKLGAGGLVRAYTDAIAAALKTAERVERIAYGTLTVSVDYADEPRVRRWLDYDAQPGCTLADTAYGALATLVLRMPATQLDAARDALRDATHGRAQFPEAEDEAHG